MHRGREGDGITSATQESTQATHPRAPYVYNLHCYYSLKAEQTFDLDPSCSLVTPAPCWLPSCLSCSVGQPNQASCTGELPVLCYPDPRQTAAALCCNYSHAPHATDIPAALMQGIKAKQRRLQRQLSTDNQALAIRSSKVLTMMPSGREVARRAISFRTVLKNFFASGGWNSIFLKAWVSVGQGGDQD